MQGLATDIYAYSGNESGNYSLYGLLENKLKEWLIDWLILYTEKAGDKSSAIRFIHVCWTNGMFREQMICKETGIFPKFLYKPAHSH